jgi:hypothetical protein
VVAQKTQVLLTDDLDGSAAQETVRFSLDKVEYEIDLNKKNAKSLRDTLGKYAAAARRANSAPRRGRGTQRTRSTAASRDADPRAVREWAAKNGVAVSERGRIPQSVLEQFAAAGGR